MEKSIIIIGAGLTGLSAGCYGRMNGYRTYIFEMHDKAGGVCTAWKRKGYTIDGAMNWLVGTRPGHSFYKFWEELGAAQDWKIFNHDRYMIREYKDGEAFHVYCDADRFENYILDMAPEDKDAIREFAEAVRTFSGFEMPLEKAPELYDSSDQATMEKWTPYMHFMEKWRSVSTQDFIQRFTNPRLRSLPYLFGGSVIWMLMTLAWQHRKSAGYPIGGALSFVASIERRYRELGGEIQFISRVEKILVENDKAVGIKLADGTEYRADYVISACDGHTTIFDMLGGKYIDDTIKDMYENPQLYKPLVYVALGVARSFDDVPPAISGLLYSLDKPIIIGSNELPYINVRVYNFDPTLSPSGKNVVVVQYNTDYEYWKKLKRQPDRYKAEKDRIVDGVIDRLNQRFPGIVDQVEMTDVATPMTWERYTGNWKGSYMGWLPDSYTENISKTLPGLDNFYMAGQWVNLRSGMPGAAMSGNHTIQFICNKDQREFVTSTK